MIRVLIVDDESEMRGWLAAHLAQENDIEVVGECTDGDDALDKIEILRPDAVFIEIELPRRSGLEVIHAPSTTKRPYMVVTTRTERYAVQAFEANVTDYLLKPLDLRRLRTAIMKLRSNMDRDTQLDGRIDLDMLMNYLKGPQQKELVRTPTDRVPVKFGRRYRFINLGAMRHIEAQGDYVDIHMVTGEVLHSGDRISEIERKLPAERFLRMHRSIIVNVEHVREVKVDKNDYEVILDNNQRFKSGPTYKSRVRKALIGGRGKVELAQSELARYETAQV